MNYLVILSNHLIVLASGDFTFDQTVLKLDRKVKALRDPSLYFRKFNNVLTDKLILIWRDKFSLEE